MSRHTSWLYIVYLRLMPSTPLATPSWAALFDMDGVLVDNTDFHVNAWLQFAQRHNRPLTKDQYVENINGRVSADAMSYMFQRPITPGELIELTEEKEAIYRELYRPHLQPAPGLLEFLTALKDQSVKLAVGTSAPESNVLFTLDGLPLRPYFDAVVDASMIHRGKPDPEIYLTAANRVGVDPARCVVFEDAFAGIEAGLRAGMKVIALATTHTRDELADVGASLIVDDFTQLTVAAVQDLTR
jgi:beta-phosphoglucomutase